MTLVLTAGQRHEAPQVPALLEQGAVARPGRGRPKLRPDRVGGDKGYTGSPVRAYLRRRGIGAVIPRRGEADTIRQNSLFVDLFNLVSSDTAKRREMYVLGRHEPLRFLNGSRAIESVLSKNAAVLARFNQRYAADGFVTVGQYWATVQDRVALIDLQDRVPAFNSDATALLDEGAAIM